MPTIKKNCNGIFIVDLCESKTNPFTVESSSVRGLPSHSRPFRVVASGVKKIKTNTPYGNKREMMFVDEYSANADGYSPISTHPKKFCCHANFTEILRFW
ncbi:hypothetical protein MtrunA17_Chr4g0053641 [Medicago truncatula]|uniref:Photosystem II 10 kDa polypeptide, chloroplastic n=1 Tax=Medicago truncatula TaxID=3880 RepID=A0A396IBK1_MEDTR|nr:hypothetical protein MtrunA17_Chr4g0053641 [Medicago truncatula]